MIISVYYFSLAAVYTEASPLIKRTILRHLEHPVSSSLCSQVFVSYLITLISGLVIFDD